MCTLHTYSIVPLFPLVIELYSIYDKAVNPLTPTKCTV